MATNKKEEPVEAEIIDERIDSKADESYLRRTDGRVFWGLLLILLGVLFLLQNYFSIYVWGIFWPIILVFIGLFLILKSSRR
jgi:uncharacterized membrane protein HdeD (DUF308 family)